MKPSGIRLGLTQGGAPRMYVPDISKTEDAIWEAVQEAITAGWTPKQFRNEARSAWDQELKNRAESEMREWNK